MKSSSRSASSLFGHFMEATSLMPFSSLPLRLRLTAAAGYELVLAAIVMLVYLIFRPYLYNANQGLKQ